MPSKTISITAEKWERVKAAFCAKFPVPMIEDPNDPENRIPQYTDAEWVFVYIKRYFARIVKAHENDRQGLDNAPALDNDMITIT